MGGGRVAVEFDINATDIMQELGAEKIYIWEQQSDGSYENVKTYSSGLIDKNTADAYRMITYYGTSGVKYLSLIHICLEGRVQSRTYRKVLEDGTAQERVAYEVSAMHLLEPEAAE